VTRKDAKLVILSAVVFWIGRDFDNPSNGGIKARPKSVVITKTAEGYTRLHLAHNLSSTAPKRMALNEPINPSIWAAAAAGRMEDALRLIEEGADVLETNWAGVSALHYAAGEGDHVVVTLLLEKGADVNGKTLSGFSPLHDAAAGGHTATVKILLDKGADVNVKTRDETTPLHGACECGHDAVVTLLLIRGADVHVKSTDLDTPLHFAVEAGHCTTVQMLLDNGANLDARNSSGETPEDLASAEGQEEAAAAVRAEATRRARWTAFAMGQHSRLGAGVQLVRGIESEVLQMILGRS